MEERGRMYYAVRKRWMNIIDGGPVVFESATVQLRRRKAIEEERLVSAKSDRP